jgi:hypothetical protein
MSKPNADTQPDAYDIDNQTSTEKRHRAPSLKVLQSRLFDCERKLQYFLDSYANFTEVDHTPIAKFASDMRSAKNAYVLAFTLVVEKVRSLGSLEEVAKLESDHCSYIQLYGTARDVLSDLYDTDSSQLSFSTASDLNGSVKFTGAATVTQSRRLIPPASLSPLPNISSGARVAPVVVMHSPQHNDDLPPSHVASSHEPRRECKENRLELPPGAFATERPRSRSSSSSSGASSASSALHHSFDPITAMLVRKDLLTPNAPFEGDPSRFHSWRAILEAKMKGLDLTPMDTIAVLQAQTSGEALQVVQNVAVTVGFEPTETLTRVWAQLGKRFGRDSQIADSIRARILNYPAIVGRAGDAKRVREFSDQCAIALAHLPRVQELQDLNTSHGLKPLRNKLPPFAQNRWRTYGAAYERKHGHPPRFQKFCRFLENLADEMSNENYSTGTAESQDNRRRQPAQAQGYSTSIDSTQPYGNRNADSPTDYSTLRSNSELKRPAAEPVCPLHQMAPHNIIDCNLFVALTPQQRIDTVKDKRLCFGCCQSGHGVNRCPGRHRCNTCKSNRHHTLLHLGTRQYRSQAPSSSSHSADSVVTSTRATGANSCGKVVPVVVSHKQSARSIICYAIIDDQSSNTFIDDDLMVELGVPTETIRYTLTTLDRCKTTKHGRRAHGLQVRGLQCADIYSLPPVMTSDMIPDCLSEVVSPEAVRAVPHLRHLADRFPPIQHDAAVQLLIGRDAEELMKTTCYGNRPPFAFKTPLGFAVVGRVLAKSDTGKSSLNARVAHTECGHLNSVVAPAPWDQPRELGIFEQQPLDDFPSLSRQDRRFFRIVSDSIHQNRAGYLEVSLPFKDDKPFFPDNSKSVYRRTASMLRRLSPAVREETLKFMAATIDKGHVELVTTEMAAKPGAAFYLPTFPVIHPKKRKVRVVFDASATFEGVSLNNMLLSGPDTNNGLRSVLQRFRERSVGFVCDVQQMFHSFAVPDHQRDFCRFFWPKGSADGQPIVSYRGKVHLFGITSSPAVAILGLRYAARGIPPVSSDFVMNSFYMDDGMSSSDSVVRAVQTLSDARIVLNRFNIRIHKFLSSHPDVLAAFPASEHAEDIASVSFDDAPVQRTLGVQWVMQCDSFVITRAEGPTFQAPTMRGLLSTVNGIFDPIGFTAPCILRGRLIVREVLSAVKPNNRRDWDLEIPGDYIVGWHEWLASLNDLGELRLMRVLVPNPSGDTLRELSLHGFCDASSIAIGMVIYVRSVSSAGLVNVAFLTASSRVAPKGAGTIPRLELCAALMLARAMTVVRADFTQPVQFVRLYTDSTIALSYLRNEERRFATFVANRVHAILSVTNIAEWTHVTTDQNPADFATRATSPMVLKDSIWLTGPLFLRDDVLPVVDTGQLETALPEVVASRVLATTVKRQPEVVGIFDKLYTRLSLLAKVLAVVNFVITGAAKWMSQSLRRVLLPRDAGSRGALVLVVREAQRAMGWTTHTISLQKLDPFCGDDGLLRVGGRIRRSVLPYDVKHPILLPSAKEHSLSKLIVESIHAQTNHQGRHLTLGRLRDEGFFVLHANRSVRFVIDCCFLCKRFRGKLGCQVMADLPIDRLSRAPPFSSVGIDCFGPYELRCTRTRRSVAVKVWVLLTTCLYCRGIHTEVLPTMETCSFLNALRRMLAVRGAVRRIRADHGTNFIGAINEDGRAIIDAAVVGDELERRKIEWVLNPPHGSHHGGVYERKILSLQRVLDVSIATTGLTRLCYDDFVTLLSEASAIVNSTPLCSVTADPDAIPISPAMLMTMKGDPHPPPVETFQEKDLMAYGRNRWKVVQRLADLFWENWRNGYLQSLQMRNKWNAPQRSYVVGDIVLLRDKGQHRTRWPFGRVETVKISDDGRVRSADVRVARDGRVTVFTRPVTELVLLVPSEAQ